MPTSMNGKTIYDADNKADREEVLKKFHIKSDTITYGNVGGQGFRDPRKYIGDAGLLRKKLVLSEDCSIDFADKGSNAPLRKNTREGAPTTKGGKRKTRKTKKSRKASRKQKRSTRRR